MPVNIRAIENRLFDAADQLWEQSGLKLSQFSLPVLGLIFLHYAEIYHLNAGQAACCHPQNPDDATSTKKFKLPKSAHLSVIITLPPEEMGKALDTAMHDIETENECLKWVLPKDYSRFDTAMLANLLKNFGTIDSEHDSSAFEKIYAFFAGTFNNHNDISDSTFITPRTIVKQVITILTPYQNLLYDPTCGAGGMFVPTAPFSEHREKVERRDPANANKEVLFDLRRGNDRRSTK